MAGKRSVTASKRFSAILNQFCPRCLRGQVFASLWKMHRRCPTCYLEFEREPGYFLGAMYFSYGLALITGAPTFFILLLLGLPHWLVLLVLGLQLVLSTPWIFRYSRIMWLHMDQVFDPR